MSHESACAFCQIIPPHMIEAMTKSADPNVRNAALANQAAAAGIRLARATIAESRPFSVAALAMGGPSKKNRVIHDAKKKRNLNGSIARREGSSNTGDKEVDEAYRFSGHVHDFYRKFFQRDSIDGNGLTLKSSVRYREIQGQPYNNAFWWAQQMAYGDGDGVVFKRFTAALDVVAHELTHGVVEYTANLMYEGESGALNESYADVFASLVKQWRKKQKATAADWLIGDDLMYPAPTRKALRSLKAPGTAYQNDPYLDSDPQPAHMKNKYKKSADNGGVHINSGIPNHAFYQLAMALGGYAWEKAGVIWYDALQRLKPTSDFDDCANATYISAGKLHGQGSLEQKAVKKAWAKVGIPV